MKDSIKILILLFIFPTLLLGQHNQIIKGRSAMKILEYSNDNSVKIKKINSELKIDSLIFADINKDGKLDYREEGFINCFISNKSNDTLKNLSVNIEESSKRLIFPDKSKINSIDPNTLLELRIPVKNIYKEALIDSIINLPFSLVIDDLLVCEEEINVVAGIKGDPSIEVSYDYVLRKDTIIDNSKDSVNYIKLNVQLKNNGDVPIFKIIGMLNLLYSGGYILSDYEQYSYEFINVGEEKEINFDLVVGSDFSQKEYPLTIDISGNDNSFKYSDKIKVEL